MKIATWNVNSVRKRTSNLLEWLKSAKPDVAVLQEIKAQEAQFPRLEIEAAGYKVEIVGQKSWNGVALLSLHPVEITARSLPDPETDDFYMVKRAARCRTCHGDGFVGIGDTAIHCDECDGSGYYWWLL